MKLRKQAGLKASIFVASAGLFAAFFALVRANPHLGAADDSMAPPAPPSADRYQRFFAGQPTGANPAPPSVPNSPHTRTRAS